MGTPSPPVTGSLRVVLHLSRGTGVMKTRVTLRIGAELFREACVVTAAEDALLSALLAKLVHDRNAVVKACRARSHAFGTVLTCDGRPPAFAIQFTSDNEHLA